MDIYSNFGTKTALVPAVQAATVNGEAIDLQNATGVGFALVTGAIVGAGAFGASLEESDDASTWTAAAAAVVSSNAPAVLLASTTYKLGYRGFKRYARLVLTKASGTSIAAGAVAVLRASDRPVALSFWGRPP